LKRQLDTVFDSHSFSLENHPEWNYLIKERQWELTQQQRRTAFEAIKKRARDVLEAGGNVFVEMHVNGRIGTSSFFSSSEIEQAMGLFETWRPAAISNWHMKVNIRLYTYQREEEDT